MSCPRSQRQRGHTFFEKIFANTKNSRNSFCQFTCFLNIKKCRKYRDTVPLTLQHSSVLFQTFQTGSCVRKQTFRYSRINQKAWTTSNWVITVHAAAAVFWHGFGFEHILKGQWREIFYFFFLYFNRSGPLFICKSILAFSFDFVVYLLFKGVVSSKCWLCFFHDLNSFGPKINFCIKVHSFE